MLSRNKQQELCMKIIFSYLSQKDIYVDKDPRVLIEEVSEIPYEEVPVFVKEIVVKVLIHENELIDIIKQNLNKWKIERMNKVVVSILLLALAEAKYIDGSLKAAIIDVAVNLTKKYCDEKDYRFVNAILDKVI